MSRWWPPSPAPPDSAASWPGRSRRSRPARRGRPARAGRGRLPAGPRPPAALADADTGDVQAQDDLAGSETKLGALLRDLNRRDESLQCQERAIAIRERLALAHPDRPTYQHNLALVLGHVGILHNDARRHDEASRAYRRAIAILQPVVAAHPEVAPYRFTLATTSHLLGVSQRRANRPDLALESYRKAQELHEALVVANPSVIDYRYELAGTLNNIANIQHSAQRPEEALATHRKATRDSRDAHCRRPTGRSLPVRDRQQLQLHRDDRGAARAAKGGAPDFSAVPRPDAGCAGRRSAQRGRTALDVERASQPGRDLCRPGPAGRGGAPFLDAIEQKRVLITSGHGTKAVVRSLCNHYHGLAGAQRRWACRPTRRRPCGTTRNCGPATRTRFTKWPAGCHCAFRSSARAGMGRAQSKRLRRKKYGDWAIDALRRAVAGGFRDAAHMNKDADLRRSASAPTFGRSSVTSGSRPTHFESLRTIQFNSDVWMRISCRSGMAGTGPRARVGGHRRELRCTIAVRIRNQ